MRWLWLTLWLTLTLPLSAAEFPPDVTLPMRVSTGLFVVQVDAIEDASDRFVALVDWRLSWRDARLAWAASPKLAERRELSGSAAREKLAQIWTPGIQMANLDGAPEITDEDLYLHSDGQIEWVRRLRGRFKASFDATSFPLDRQALAIDIVSPVYTLGRLNLASDQASRDFTGHAQLSLAGWTFGRVWFRPSTFTRWNGAPHSEMRIELTAQRQLAPYIFPIFVPIAAVLLVPLLSLWLNRWHAQSFVVEPFELMNVTTGGLFATIALTLAVYSVYPFLNSGENLVGRLFALNYVLLGISMLAILLLFKPQMAERPPLSPYVAREIYFFILWSMPALTLVTSIGLFLWALP